MLLALVGGLMVTAGIICSLEADELSLSKEFKGDSGETAL